MKIAFINNAFESLGVEYLCACLKRHGHTVELFVDPQLFSDENLKNTTLNGWFCHKKKILKDVADFDPDLIGFSVVSDFYEWACSLAADCKKILRNTPIIFGGVHPTSSPEEVIKNDFVDMICLGEGEAALVEVVEKLRCSQAPEDTKNIWLKKGDKIIRNKVRPLLENLDTLPTPDKTIFWSKSPHFAVGYFTMASRGCIYACSYCSHSHLRRLYPDNGYYRCRSVGGVIAELEKNFSLKRHRYIRFLDDIFPFNKEWLKEFSAIYSKRIGAPFICYIHPNTSDEETAYLLKKCGCREIRLGVQTLYEDTQKKTLNRCVKKEKLEKVISWFKKYGIVITAENIMGIPGQNEEEIKDLIGFYCKNKVGRIHVFWLRYYPGTAITERFAAAPKTENTHFKTFTSGGDVFTKDLGKIAMLFLMLNLLPGKIIRLMLKKRTYRYFLAAPLLLLDGLLNLFSRTYSCKITRKRVLLRYFIYMRRVILSRWGAKA